MLTEHENRLLGCFLNRGEKRQRSQPDADIEERKQRILGQMVAPVTRQVLYLQSRTSVGVAASGNDTVVSKASETEIGSQSQLPVRSIVAEQQEECDWYVPLFPRRSTQPFPNLSQYTKHSPICLDAILPEHMVRQMPHCRHFFHQKCCETWISKTLKRWKYLHICRPMACPVCRTSLESPQEDTVKKPGPAASMFTGIRRPQPG
jgi:Ring finger domain